MDIKVNSFGHKILGKIKMRVSLETLKALKDAEDYKAGLAWSDMKAYQDLFGSGNVLAYWRPSGEYEVYYEVKEKVKTFDELCVFRRF
jgi:hypothetical protein